MKHFDQTMDAATTVPSKEKKKNYRRGGTHKKGGGKTRLHQSEGARYVLTSLNQKKAKNGGVEQTGEGAGAEERRAGRIEGQSDGKANPTAVKGRE